MDFKFGVDLINLAEPTVCQDADRVANLLEGAANYGFEGETQVFVTSIGNVVTYRTDGGFTDCKGSLEGQTFIGQYDGTRSEDYRNPAGAVTRVQFEVKHHTFDCSTAACFQNLYNKMVSDFTSFATTGDFTTKIVTNAADHVRPFWSSC